MTHKLGPDDSTPPRWPRDEPVTRSFLERLAPERSGSSAVVAASLIAGATAAAAGVPDALTRCLVQLGAGVLIYVLGWFAPQPGKR